MRKLFTLIAMLAGTMAAMATDYTDKLVVTIDGTYTPATDNVISVEEQADGTYNLLLKNFILKFSEEDIMPVGTINVTNVKGTKNGVSTLLTTNQNIIIEPGDMPGIFGWIGTELGPVPVNVNADMKDNHLYALITISFMGMNIEVTFGDVYQIGNSGFEYFHTATVYSPDGENSATSDEPNNWHSFMSASGEPALIYLAGYTPHTFKSDVTRPESKGSSSVLLTSSDMGFFGVANGTITTGRMNTGSVMAADISNHTWNDLSQTDMDDNGDPFFAAMHGRPDSMVVWVKFTQGTPNAEFPYATVSAVINDGTYYQDPEDKEYTNVLAKAVNAQIESNDGAWQRLAIPFDYETYKANNAEGKAILVTISTNATPGKGSTDELYVDDMEMVYNCSATAITVKGTSIEGFGTAEDNTYEVLLDGENASVSAADIVVETDGKGARVLIETADVDLIGGGSDVTITVLSEDLKNSNTYVVKTRNSNLSGINNASVNAGGKAEIKAVYNMNGQMVKAPLKGSVYVVKYTNGKTEKVTLK
ncbi:MAG: calycin-like domain-containing protein [Prevotella sp.]|nr:calycin-like domain-containing protein [Prevotella sp.]